MVNYSEYNKVYLRRGDCLYSFIKNLDHAVQKSGAYDAVMHQLKCIGWSEELIETASEAAAHYKSFHKDRIKREQERICTFSTGDVVYPVVLEYRLPDAERIYVTVVGVASSAEAAEENMRKQIDDIKKRFRENILEMLPDKTLTFEATACDGRYEMRLDGTAADAFFRVWIGKTVFL